MSHRGGQSSKPMTAMPQDSVEIPHGLTHDVPGINCELLNTPRHPAYPYTEWPNLYHSALHGDPGRWCGIWQYGGKDGMHPLRPSSSCPKEHYSIVSGHHGCDPANRNSAPATTLRELKWQGLMNEITDKLDWQSKVLNKEIQAKWKHEALESGKSVREGFSVHMADKMIEELKTKAAQYESDGWTVAYDPGVVKSDSAISEILRQELLAAVRPLEHVPEAAKDWHPGSNNQVLDLVHPSLWPLIYGQTKILPSRLGHDEDPIAYIGAGFRLPSMSTTTDAQWQYSRVFQWLPAEISFNENKQANFTSYINNLHPHRHKRLYGIIEKIVDAAIPLWSRTLSSWPVQQRIILDQVVYLPMPEIERMEGEMDVEYEDRAWEEHENMKSDYVVQPEPHDKEIKYDITDIKGKFHAGLQVIVKLANIELKPGESYAGGSWHVEGQANEAIVASALYYYSSDNISDSRLAFRHSTDPDEFGWHSDIHPEMELEQNEDQFLGPIYGTSNYQTTVQELGSVLCREGRLITFPNTLQHRVLPFELKDKTKAGHRKILALFLVDPHLRIVSTAVVPPQQRDWWTERIMQTGDISLTERLPPEIVQLICSYVDDPMPLAAAKEWRLKLMEERSRYVKDQDESYTAHEYNLCEH